MQGELGVSERRACSVLGQARSTQSHKAKRVDDEEPLTSAIINYASQYGRYGYRRITALLRRDGWHVNPKRVIRIWRREGLKVPIKQPKRRRLWFNDGSCVRLRAARPNHVWSYDFVADRTHDGRPFRMLTVIDEFTRESLALPVERRLRSDGCTRSLTSSPREECRNTSDQTMAQTLQRSTASQLAELQTAGTKNNNPWRSDQEQTNFGTGPMIGDRSPTNLRIPMLLTAFGGRFEFSDCLFC